MATSAPRWFGETFRYSATARACAGEMAGERLTADVCELPADGGYTHLIWNRFFFRNLAMGEGYAEAQGQRSKDGKAWETWIRIALERVNLSEVLTIGRMTATLLSSCPVEAKNPEFSLLGTTFADVRIAGTPVELELNQLGQTPITYEAETSDERFRRGKARSEPDSDGKVIVPLVNRVSGSWDRTGGGVAEGNRITIPGFGRVVLGELAVERQRCHLCLVRAELDGFISGRIDIGVLTIDNENARTPLADIPENENALPLSAGLDEEEEQEVLAELNDWVNTHPGRDEPFLFFMGRSLTPAEFFNEVEGKTELGISFLRFLGDQSKRFDEHPRDAIRRAVDANRSE